MPQPQESRRVISRSSKSTEVAGSEVIKTEPTNIIHKEPFNEDLELETTSLDLDYKWKDGVIGKFKELLDDIKLLQQHQDKSRVDEKYKQGLLLCATLKKLNRVSHLRVNKARLKTYEEKNKIDEYHLELQNLLYEISHIKKEINKCLEFKSLDETINLVPVEEFYKNAPVEISNPEVTQNNPHKLKLARLDYELNQRQSMVNRIKQLETTIASYKDEIKSKNEQLESLHPKLNQIFDACKPTLEYLNTNFDDECYISELVQYLPRPLYTCYMMMSAYRDTTDKTMKVEVTGDLEAAKVFDLNEKIDLDDDGDSDSDDDNENDNNYKQKAKNKINKKTSKSLLKEKIFKPHPLKVKLTLSIKNIGNIILNLSYLNILKIVTVKVDIDLEKDVAFTDNSVLRADNIFTCLYENDWGNESPNIANKLIFNSLGIESIEPYVRVIGHPYKWSQLLCGLNYNTESNQSNNTQQKSSSTGKSSNNAASNEDKASTSQAEAGEQSGSGNLETTNEVNEEDDDLTGNDELFSPLNSTKNEAKLLQKIIFKLKSRFKSRYVLQDAINSLKRGVIPFASNFPQQIKQIQAKLVSFKETNYEKFVSSTYTKHFVKSNIINENECAFYEINLQNGNAKLQAQIVINQDYPNITPIFAINICLDRDRNYNNDEAIRDMERELNVCKDNYILKQFESSEVEKSSRKRARLTTSEQHFTNYELITKQINHLFICFDIYLESESYILKNNEFPRYKFFLNAVRGRDRKRPYSYLESRDIFIQRLDYELNK